MSLDFLWDEEKTRKLFKTHLILFMIGGIVASIYTLLLPTNTPYRIVLMLIPIIISFSCLIYFLLLPKPNPGFRLLIFTLEAQLAAAIFMAVTGGFSGIVQFAPYMFILFAVFELGTTSTLILGIFSIFTFIGIFLWSLIMNPYPGLPQEFFYYVGSYCLIVVIERNIGKELSLQFEAKKRLEQIDDVKNQFITLTSHYLRTPLTIIKGFVSKMKDTSDVKSVEETIHSMEALIENLLMISSIEQGHTTINPISSDLNQLLKDIILSFQQKAINHKLTLTLKSPDLISNFIFDPAKLKNAISNLVENAIEYNKIGGIVEISSEVIKNQVIIKVADSGIGIKKDNLNSLFSPFSKGSMNEVLNFSHPGVGLSLYITKLIIDAHKGKISVYSEEDKGSIFTITLPIK